MSRKQIILGLILAVFLAIFISPLASKRPDGLEKMLRQEYFLEKAKGGPWLASPLAGYLWPGIKNEKIAIALAATVGTLAVFSITFLLAVWLKKQKSIKK